MQKSPDLPAGYLRSNSFFIALFQRRVENARIPAVRVHLSNEDTSLLAAAEREVSGAADKIINNY